MVHKHTDQFVEHGRELGVCEYGAKRVAVRCVPLQHAAHVRTPRGAVAAQRIAALHKDYVCQ